MPAKKKTGLGRGLDVLLPDDIDLDSGLRQIPIGDIDRNTEQPRQRFDEESLQSLAQSIRDQGILQPLLVVPTDGGRFMLVAGERRWRAARLAGLEDVPCIVRTLDVIRQKEIALIENLQREDLNPIEQAQGIQSLMRQCGYTQETVAARVGRSRPAVANLLRLLTLPDKVQAMVKDGTLSAGHARVLAGLESDEMKLRLAGEVIEKGLSVRELESMAALLKQPDGPKKATRVRQLPVELVELEDRIRSTMGLRVTLTGSATRGKIVLNYNSAEELEYLNDQLLRLNEEE